jgi:hypothetical protein
LLKLKRLKSAYISGGKAIHFFSIALLIGLAIVLFYPVLSAEYAYTDEIVQLWFYPQDRNYQMFLPQGRYVTEQLFRWLFGSIHQVSEISKPRIFSLSTGLLSIPVWYFVFHQVVRRERLSQILPFFATLYFICTPQFSIYASWASCLELFIANTAGLLSGYLLYSTMRDQQSKFRMATSVVLSLGFGVISLFSYQNGFGCFLIPFVLYLIANPREWKLLLIAVGVYFLIYILYYLLFRLNLRVNDVIPNDRTKLHINPVNKFRFMYTRPLSSAFHFTYLFNEKSIGGYIMYMLILFGWVGGALYRLRHLPFSARLRYFMFVFALFGLMYIPSLIIKENYSSNRTLLALKMAVFFLVMELLIDYFKKSSRQKMFAGIVSVLFVMNAWFNFNKQFLGPVTKEYHALRSAIETSFNPGVTGYHFIRPQEDFFVRKYGITRSWDEFGVPSSFFEWVPEFLVKQIIFEKTGDLGLARSLQVRHWSGAEAYKASGEARPPGTVLLDAERIMK